MTWKQRQLSGECAAKCISGSIKHYSSSALVAMATDWQMQGKMEKPRPLIETLALHHPYEFDYIGECTVLLWAGWNNEAVLLNDKMSSVQNCNTNSAEPSYTQAYPRIEAGIDSILYCQYLWHNQNPETFLLFQKCGEKITRKS